MRWLSGLITAAALVGFSHADDASDAAKKLEGTYSVVDLLIEGKPNPKKDEVAAVVLKDGTITIKLGKRDEAAKFALDPSKKPKEIDISPINSKDEKVSGIYETKETDQGLELTIAFAKENGPRPKDFKGTGKDEVVLKLLRKK